MLALILFALVEEDVDESSAAAVEDMEVLTTLDKAVVAAVAVEALAVLRVARILFCLFIIDLHRRKAGWRSFIRQILQLLRIEPGVSVLFFNTWYSLESVRISCSHQPNFAISSANSISSSSIELFFWPVMV